MQQYTIQPGVLLTPLDCAEKSAGSAGCFACAVVFLSFFLCLRLAYSGGAGRPSVLCHQSTPNGPSK